MFTCNDKYTFLLLIFVVFLLGSSPISKFSDRYLYTQSVFLVNHNIQIEPGHDLFFYYYVKLTGLIFTPQLWLYFTAFIYVFNHFFFSKRIIGYYMYPLFLMFITGFFFYGYGVNTIRAGLAASFLLLALANYNKITYFLLFIVIAVNCHFSMIIPAGSMILSRFFDKTKLFICFWILVIPLSMIFGHTFENFFATLSSDSRTSYLSVDSDETIYKVGFRIDFILYSCVPVIMGYYYIIKRGIKDTFYSILYNTYILANCFWILVIRANFSDRFAYLSWFIYPAVIIYPALKYQLWNRQNEKVGLIVLLHGLFTYIMFLR